MCLYRKYLLPRLIDLVMRNKESARLRESWLPQARGEVVEIGIGSGLNLPFYSSEVSRVRGVDSSCELLTLARKRAGGLPFEVELIRQSAEETLPLESESADSVVVTWSLCSIPNPLRALQQMRRVLKPSGRLIFIEHGLAADPRVAAWQNRLTPIWKRIGGGCHLNRKVDALIGEAGFSIVELKTRYLAGPRPMTYTYQGLAQLPHG